LLIDYELVRSDRKSITITIDRDSKVIVNAPKNLNEEEIEKYIYKKRLWIWEKLAIKKSAKQNMFEKKFVSGESFSYLGRRKQSKAKEMFKDWYSIHLKNKIDERLEIICSEKKIEKPTFRIMELGFRWGSCTKEGSLNFNWKIAMAPLSIIDYVILHEIVHLKEHTHNEKFWKEILKLMPNYLEKKEWLKINGYMLDI
jgi:predicted metal-dependent hydrolase